MIVADQKTAQARFDICKSCDRFFKPTASCKECGCFMKAKVKLNGSVCPVGKW